MCQKVLFIALALYSNNSSGTWEPAGDHIQTSSVLHINVPLEVPHILTKARIIMNKCLQCRYSVKTRLPVVSLWVRSNLAGTGSSCSNGAGSSSCSNSNNSTIGGVVSYYTHSHHDCKGLTVWLHPHRLKLVCFSDGLVFRFQLHRPEGLQSQKSINQMQSACCLWLLSKVIRPLPYRSSTGSISSSPSWSLLERTY